MSFVFIFSYRDDEDGDDMDSYQGQPLLLCPVA